MLLELTHQTELRYSDIISESVMELRVCPVQSTDQHRLSFDLAIGPPAQVSSYFDWLDNLVHTFSVTGYHQHLRIIATSVVETVRQSPDFHAMPDAYACDLVDGNWQLHDYLQFGGPIVDSPRLRALVDEVAPRPGEPLADVLTRLLDLIRTHFTYTKGVTTSASPISEVLEHKRGVCQDFSHLMIAACRAMRIPAKYISGLVHSERRQKDADGHLKPAGPEQGHFLGASQTHAWCEVWFPSLADRQGNGAGWVGFDPTNQCPIESHFVKVASGRHFADVPPNRGVYRGVAKEKIDVRVRSRRLPGVPTELAAEHMRRLNLPVSATPPTPAGAEAGQQQQQQQQ